MNDGITVILLIFFVQECALLRIFCVEADSNAKIVFFIHYTQWLSTPLSFFEFTVFISIAQHNTYRYWRRKRRRRSKKSRRRKMRRQRKRKRKRSRRRRRMRRRRMRRKRKVRRKIRRMRRSRGEY